MNVDEVKISTTSGNLVSDFPDVSTTQGEDGSLADANLSTFISESMPSVDKIKSCSTSTLSSTSGHQSTSQFPSTSERSSTSGYPCTSQHLSTSGHPPTSGYSSTTDQQSSARHQVIHGHTSGYRATSEHLSTSIHHSTSGHPSTSELPSTTGHPPTSGYSSTTDQQSTARHQVIHGHTSGYRTTSEHLSTSIHHSTSGHPSSSELPSTSGIPSTPGHSSTSENQSASSRQSIHRLISATGYPSTSEHLSTSRLPSYSTSELPSTSGIPFATTERVCRCINCVSLFNIGQTFMADMKFNPSEKPNTSAGPCSSSNTSNTGILSHTVCESSSEDVASILNKVRSFVEEECSHCLRMLQCSVCGDLISNEKAVMMQRSHAFLEKNLKHLKCYRCEDATGSVCSKPQQPEVIDLTDSPENSCQTSQAEPHSSTDQPRVPCQICGKTYKNKYTLKTHLSKHTNLPVSPPGSTLPGNQNQINHCSLCGQACSKEMATVSDETSPISLSKMPFRCRRCSGKFDETNSGRRGRPKGSTNSDIVDLSYSSLESRSLMLQGLESRDIVCGAESTTDILHPPCPICGKRYKNKYTLKTHLRIHTNERPFKCEICGKAFRAKGVLKTHRLTHEDSRPFKCEVCQKCFKQKSTLITHSKLHVSAVPDMAQSNNLLS